MAQGSQKYFMIYHLQFNYISMPKGRSYTSDFWKSFEKGNYSFIDDGFVHDKTFNFKAQFEKENQGVAINESIVEKAQGLSGNGQVKFWFTTNSDKTMFISLGSATNLHIHYDNGVGSLKNISQNMYGIFEFNRSLTQKIGKVGIQLFKDNNWSFNTRLLYNFSRKTFSLDEKTLLRWKNFKLNAYTNIDFINQFTFNKTGILLAWEPQGTNSIWFSKLYKAQGEKVGKSIEGLIVGWNSKINLNQIIGFQAKINLRNPWKGVQNLWLASQWKFADTTIKAKVNKELSHALSVTKKLGNFGEYSFGVQVNEVGTKNRFRFGTQIELNL